MGMTRGPETWCDRWDTSWHLQALRSEGDPVRTTKFDDEESARQHANREAARSRRYMAVVEDEGSFYVMTMRNADAYARPHPETVFIVYQAEPPAT